LGKVSWGLVACFALIPLVQLKAQSPHSAVSQTNAIRSAAVTCSSGRHFATKVRWQVNRGIVIDQAAAEGINLPRRELDKVKELIGGATFLDYVQMWCSGDQDGGIRIAYIIRLGGQPTPMLLDLQIRGRHLLVGSNTVRLSG
jgi:hypothetical protein